MTRNEGKRERVHGQVEARLSRIIGSQLDMFPNAIATLADAVLDEIWHELDERLYEAAQINIAAKDKAITDLTAERDDYRQRFRNQQDAATELIAKLGRAEAAVRRTLAYCDDFEAALSAQRVDPPPWVSSIRHLLKTPAEEEKNLPSSGGAS